MIAGCAHTAAAGPVMSKHTAADRMTPVRLRIPHRTGRRQDDPCACGSATAPTAGRMIRAPADPPPQVRLVRVERFRPSGRLGLVSAAPERVGPPDPACSRVCVDGARLLPQTRVKLALAMRAFIAACWCWNARAHDSKRQVDLGWIWSAS